MNGITEKLLLYRLQVRHDTDAFAELYDAYVKRIYRFVYFKVGSHEEAEDITADVFLKAWNYIINNDEKEIKSFSGLLYRIARNCVIDLYRSRSVQPETVRISEGEESDIGDQGKWTENLSAKVEAQKIIQGLNKLKQEYREVLTLKYVDELDAKEIAVITGKGQIAIRVTLHRALKKLKEVLEK